jgi:photosystem II stability/assembly factor-like uncharacterized protein
VRRWSGTIILAAVLLGLVVAAAACGGHLSAPSATVQDVKPTGPPYNGKTDSLTLVAFPDVSHSWAAGDIYHPAYSITGTSIQATTNGGVTWREQKSGNWGGSWGPWAMAFADAKCGWLLTGASMDTDGNYPSGDANTILATTDGGATWKYQHSRTGIELSDIACAGSSHAWAVGSDPSDSGFKSIIIATSDGGTYWTTQYLTTVGNRGLEAVAFANADHGWAVGDAGLILATTDGGATWNRQSSPTRLALADVVCTDATHAWALPFSGDNPGTILATTDGGATWKLQHTGKVQTRGVNSMAFVDSMHGWVVGFGGVILATTDGGNSWKPQRSGTKADLAAVAFADATHGLAVGNRFVGADPMSDTFKGSTILRTTDGGATWNH